MGNDSLFIDKYTFHGNKKIKASIEIFEGDTTIKFSLPFFNKNIKSFFFCFFGINNINSRDKNILFLFDNLNVREYNDTLYAFIHEGTPTIYTKPDMTLFQNKKKITLDLKIVLMSMSKEIFCLYFETKDDKWFYIEVIRKGIVKTLSSCYEYNSFFFTYRKYWTLSSERIVKGFVSRLN